MSKALNLFIIDDDDDDKEMFCEAVSDINKSFRCLSASNGQEALQILENAGIAPDFIFLDLNMPRMNGKQLLIRLKENERFSSIPVSIYSTSKLQADKEETRQLGADHFITKPSSLMQLKKDLEFVFAKKFKNNFLNQSYPSLLHYYI